MMKKQAQGRVHCLLEQEDGALHEPWEALQPEQAEISLDPMSIADIISEKASWRTTRKHQSMSVVEQEKQKILRVSAPTLASSRLLLRKQCLNPNPNASLKRPSNSQRKAKAKAKPKNPSHHFLSTTRTSSPPCNRSISIPTLMTQ